MKILQGKTTETNAERYHRLLLGDTNLHKEWGELGSDVRFRALDLSNTSHCQFAELRMEKKKKSFLGGREGVNSLYKLFGKARKSEGSGKGTA